jgi:cytochrome d ubiquinol oxidase subunit I
MAASEGLYETVPEGVGAPFSIITVGTLDGSEEVWAVTVPKLLSYLGTGSLTGEVHGINNLQEEYRLTYAGEELTETEDYRPIIPVTYWSFRLMVGLGFAAMGVAAVTLWFLWKRREMQHRAWFWVAVTVAVLPLLANSFGWIFTEMGRQPWLVFGLMTTETGVSPGTTSAEVITSMTLFTLLYAVLAAVELGLILRYGRAGADPYDGRSLDPRDRADDEPFVFTY